LADWRAWRNAHLIEHSIGNCLRLCAGLFWGHAFPHGCLLCPTPNAGQTKLLRFTLLRTLWDTCFHLLQLCGFGRRCNRLRYRRLWRFGALCPLHVNGTLDGLKLGFSGLGPVTLVACLGKRVLIHPRHAGVVTAGCILDNVLQDATPTLFGGLLALGFLLACYGFKVRLSTKRRCLLLLRTLCSFNGCKLVYDVGIFLGCALALVFHVNEVTHGSGLLGCTRFGFF
jgi:hypothetical protein